MKVAILGASAKPERYSYKAIMLLREHRHEVYPVNPGVDSIEGIKVYATLGELPVAIDTVTLYLGAARQAGVVEALLAVKPRRVIFNPGTENLQLEAQLHEAGVEVERACTLVLLKSDAF